MKFSRNYYFRKLKYDTFPKPKMTKLKLRKTIYSVLFGLINNLNFVHANWKSSGNFKNPLFAGLKSDGAIDRNLGNPPTDRTPNLKNYN